VIVFAAEHPQETAGVILVDSVNPDRIPPPTVLKNELIMWLYRTTAPFGIPRLLGQCPVGTTSCRQYAKTFAAMREARFESAQIARSMSSLGDLSLIVIARDPQHYLQSDKTIERRQREEAWAESQEGLLGLSTEATLLVAGGAGHSIPQENPQIVVDAVDNMMQSIRWTQAPTVETVAKPQRQRRPVGAASSKW
jgi:pimeloyl-ACP methyl ester carboxylesterase